MVTEPPEQNHYGHGTSSAEMIFLGHFLGKCILLEKHKQNNRFGVFGKWRQELPWEMILKMKVP